MIQKTRYSSKKRKRYAYKMVGISRYDFMTDSASLFFKDSHKGTVAHDEYLCDMNKDMFDPCKPRYICSQEEYLKKFSPE